MQAYWRCDNCDLHFVTHSRKQPEECHSCHLPSVRRNWNPTEHLYGATAMFEHDADWLRDKEKSDE